MGTDSVIFRRKYVTCCNDPILVALGEYLDIEKTGVNGVIDSQKVALIYNNGIKRPYMEAIWKSRQASHKPTYVMERGSLPNTSIIDKNGMLANSSSYDIENWNHPLSETSRKQIEEYIAWLTESSDTLEKQVSDSNRNNFQQWLPPSSCYDQIVFVPEQKPGDTTILMWSRWVKDIPTFRQLVYELASKNPSSLFIIKPHPLSSDKNIVQTHNVRNAVNMNYKDCLYFCDRVFVINSGVGLQAMAWKKPTYIFGKSHYHFAGINQIVDNEKEMQCALTAQYIFNDELSLRYLYYLKFVLWSDCDLTNGAKQCKYLSIRMN